MQPDALLYSITATNSSFTRNLKGMIPAMRMQSLDHGRRTPLTVVRAASPATPMFHAKRG